MIELRPSTPHAVGIVDPVNPPTLRILESEAVLDSVWPGFCRCDLLRRDLDPVAAGKLELQAIKAQQKPDFMVLLRQKYRIMM